jgi:hypothetical protein
MFRRACWGKRQLNQRRLHGNCFLSWLRRYVSRETCQHRIPLPDPFSPTLASSKSPTCSFQEQVSVPFGDRNDYSEGGHAAF